jgi:hypothetical protein
MPVFSSLFPLALREQMIKSMRVKDGQQIVNSMKVLVDATSPEDFGTMDTRQKVLIFARQNGLPMASGLDVTPGSYPVDEEGNTSEDIMTAKKKFSHFQAEYTVNSTFM